MSMELTKRLWEQPTDKGVLAYHIIQSFSPGEATPDQVHEIGCEFARRFLADRFECTVSTHLDKGHLHNHMLYLRFTKARFYIVDPENEYAPLVQELGGEVVNISVDSSTYFNPLDFKPDKSTDIPPYVAKAEFMANTCPQTKEQKMQRQKARSEIANAKPKGKRQVKASQGNTSYGKMVKQDKPFVKKQNTHTEQKPTAK